MSFVDVHPELLTAAAGNLSGIGDAMTEGIAAGAAPTTGVIPAAVDPVSGMAAGQLNTNGELFQQFSALAAAAHQQIVATMNNNAARYAIAEAANAASAAATSAI
ncbi:PE family protein [Mycobacterium sp. M1]|uniref:PE family protein n=1 Tax=Mycolicibacter acidiphilus TaxID=2835306 RepID=A0ABS5RCX6_9MYCO|nr:PE family protein [Mycolicibacter acidiphilus]MBS9532141.1 PE family protein [Mycolicibacter acidiphilus]